MREKIAAVMACIGLVLAGQSACAMSVPAQPPPHCRVVGGEKLPTESGGADALCVAIDQAAAARAPGLTYSVEVRVISPSRLEATLRTADGRVLPKQEYAVSDREITRTSFQRFADAIANELGKAASR